MRRAGDLEFRLVELAGQLRNLTDQSATAQAHLTHTLDERLDQVNHRLGASLNDQAERTGHTLRQLHERLAVIDSAQRNLAALSGEMVSLKDILSNKQARGAYGQARMEAIIRDGLQSSAYSFQSTLSNGTRPDCLVQAARIASAARHRRQISARGLQCAEGRQRRKRNQMPPRRACAAT